MTGIVDDCAALALAGLLSDVAQRFADDPIGTLIRDLNLKVRAVGQLDHTRTDGGTCDGISYLSDGIVLYRQTGNRRENFTLAHELGHWLVDRTDAVYDLLAQQERSAELLETVCDAIARSLLIPEERVRAVVGAGPVLASHVVALYEATSASIHACAIAIAERLPCLGAVLAFERASASVLHASVHIDDQFGWPTVYPWPRQMIPTGHPLKNLRPHGSLRQLTFWATPWGARDHFYMDAIGTVRGGLVVMSANDLWGSERFHPASQREFDQRPRLEVRCCGRERQVLGWPCPTCQGGFCPECGNCACSRQAATEIMCAGGCYMRYLPHLLVDGRCEICR